MQKSFKQAGMLLILLSVFSSCTIQKRLYNRGFHLEWRETGRKGPASSNVFKAKKAVKVPKVNTEIVNDNVHSADIITPPPVVNLRVSGEVPAQALMKYGNRHSKQLPQHSILFSAMHQKAATIPIQRNYYDFQDGEVSSAVAGFLTSLIALLLIFVFGSVIWGTLMAVTGIVLSVMGIVEQTGNQDTVNLILAVLGLIIGLYAINYAFPILHPFITFFIANPGILLCLLLILALYILMGSYWN